MSMLLDWTSASEAKIAALIANPKDIEWFISEACECDANGTLGKAWHGLHYVLTGSVDGDQAPHCYLMMGGRTIGEVDLGYGPARALSPAEVADWHRALSAISDDDIRAKFSPEAMDRDGVYPSIWVEDPEDGLAFLLQGFETLKQGIGGIAATGNGLIIWMN